jgi:hypothetical protein
MPTIIEADFENNISPEIRTEEKKEIGLYFEYNPKIKNLIISNLSSPVLDINLTEYNRCNLNNICDEDENKLLCPEDCPNSQKDGLCQNIEDDICKNDPDCEGKDPDCIIKEYKNSSYSKNQEINNVSQKEIGDIETKSTNFSIKTVSFLIILFAIVLIYLYIKRKRN